MRIIAGRAKGTRLRVIDSPGLRPTGDRQRETLFNVIREVVPDAMILDAFAGTGALGLEALSRGGRATTFIERSRRVVATLRDNIERCRFDNEATVIVGDALGVLRRLERSETRFDLLFADPPWGDDEGPAWLAALAAVARPEALLCLERSKGDTVVPGPDWDLRRELAIGDTAFHLLVRLVPSDRDC